MAGESTGNPRSHVPSRRELRAQREAAERVRVSGLGEADSQAPEAHPHVPVIEEYQGQVVPLHESEEPRSIAKLGESRPVQPQNASVERLEETTTGSDSVSATQSPRTSDPAVPFSGHNALPHGGRAKPKRLKNVITTVSILVLIAILVAGVYYALTEFIFTGESKPSDYQGAGTGSVTVEIPEGATGSKIADALVAKDIVATKQAFINVLAVNPEGTNIQPGTYKLKQQMSAAAALAGLLDKANRVDIGITIPEGFRLSQLQERLQAGGGYTEAEVQAAFADPAAIGLPPEANGNAEGWIAPGTYQQKPNESVESMVKSMIQRRIDELDSLNVPADQRQTLLIKASILEREVNINKYLPKVARVIENRLDPERGKEVLNKLQMDSTVAYAAGRTSGIPTANELKIDSPYNTYLHAGLPPTPISFPGVEAIKAVLKPEAGNWLYFVSINLDTGETVFVDTYEQFKEAKNQLKQFCESNPKSC